MPKIYRDKNIFFFQFWWKIVKKNYFISFFRKELSKYTQKTWTLFENLTEDSIEKFIGVFRIDDISTQTWRNICRRLLPNKMKEDSFDQYNMMIVDKSYVFGKIFQ